MTKINNNLNQACKDYFKPKKLWNEKTLGKIKAVGAVISYFTVVVPIFMKFLQIASKMCGPTPLKNKVTPLTNESIGPSKTTNAVGLSSIKEEKNEQPPLKASIQPISSASIDISQSQPAASICPFHFDGSMPLTSIYTNDRLRNNLRSYLTSDPAKEQFKKDFKAYLNTYNLEKSGYAGVDIKNEESINKLKNQIIDATLKNINDPDLNPKRENNNKNLDIPLGFIITNDQTKAFLDKLVKNQLIGKWEPNDGLGSPFITLTTLFPTEEPILPSSPITNVALNLEESKPASPSVLPNPTSPPVGPFRFDRSFPITSIYTDENLRNEMRNQLKSKAAEDKFVKDFKSYLSTYTLKKDKIALINQKNGNAIENIKKQIITSTIGNINDAKLSTSNFLIKLSLDKDLIRNDDLFNLFHLLVKNQVIGGWGLNRLELFVSIVPITHLEEKYIINSMDGCYYLKVDSKIHRKDFNGRKIDSDSEIDF